MYVCPCAAPYGGGVTPGEPPLHTHATLPFSSICQVLAILSQKLALIKNARMHVWERKQHCVPGVAYTFGGTEGNSPLEDFTYLLAWRPLEPEEVVNPGACGKKGLCPSLPITDTRTGGSGLVGGRWM